MNILYIAFKDFSKSHYGASKKVISECRAFEKIGHQVKLIGRDGHMTVIMYSDGSKEVIANHKTKSTTKLQNIYDKSNQINDIIKFIKDNKYDLCYIRYDLSTLQFVNLVKRLHSCCKNIFIEIPTYPYDKEYSGKLNSVRIMIDRIFAKKLKKYVNKVISFYEIPNGVFFDIPVLVVPNGFDFDGIKLNEDELFSDELHIAAVSSMRIWHGYERMIEGMHHYYQAGGKRKIFLYLAGDGREKAKYEELVNRYGLQNNVLFCGPLSGVELDKLLEKCNLGIDSLARHRTNITVLSSLKSREYGAKGIPIINSCDIDIIDDEFDYFLKVSADDKPIDVQQIIDFYDRIYKNEDRRIIAQRIREYVERKSGMLNVMQKVLNGVDG